MIRTTPDVPGPAERITVTESALPATTLSWGIKDSFRDYLSRQADFSLDLDGSATVGAGNRVHFPVIEDRPMDEVPDGGVVTQARGTALFRAHHGMMKLSLKDPAILKRGSGLVLALDFSVEDGRAVPDYFEVARLVELPAAAPDQREYRTMLLSDATGMFNDMYEADSELDVVQVGVPAGS